MTKEPISLRESLEKAVALHDVAVKAGVTDPAQLAKLLQLGTAVASFVGQKPAPAKTSGPRFERLADGIVRDNTSGLEWDTADFAGKEFTHAKTVKACAELRTGGHTDWRLPTVQELLTLVDYTLSDPAIDKEFFPNCKSSWYRTSTPYAPSPGCAWIVSFGSGYSGFDHHGNRYYVRAVRASQVL